MKSDNQLLVITHLSQLSFLIIGFGSLIIPIILWATKKDDVQYMDEHGKKIINFQLSLILYTILSIPLILAFGLGLLGLLVVGALGLIFPIINAVKLGKGEAVSYPLSINFIN